MIRSRSEQQKNNFISGSLENLENLKFASVKCMALWLSGEHTGVFSVSPSSPHGKRLDHDSAEAFFLKVKNE